MEEKKFYNLKFLKRTVLGSLLALAVLFVLVPVWVKAQQLNTGIEFGQYTGLIQTDIRIIIAKIIRAFLGVLGIVALGFTLYGGYIYMTAGGDDTKVKTSKAILKNMVIGLAIILSAFAITQFVINMLTGQYQGGGGGETPPPFGTEGFCSNCGFLGSVVESHYPGRGATAIPRNTKIVVTFKYEMLSSTLITDSNSNLFFGDTLGASTNNNDHPTASFKIYPTAQGESASLSPDQLDVFLAADKKTYVFSPKVLLGSTLADTNYTIKLTEEIQRADGTSAFGNLGNYSWGFTVSTIADMTPPEVISVIPVPQTNKYDRNLVVQINFNEPVNPISASGVFQTGSTVLGENFQNITAAIIEGSNPLISGKYQITNQYKTVEFKTFDQCGSNPCGQPIYCLPADKTISGTVKSATVDPTNRPQAAITANLYDGVVDMAGNSLNGAGELKRNAEQELILDPGIKNRTTWEAVPSGQKVLNDFTWNFLTKNSLHLTAPLLTSITPVSLAAGVVTSSPVIMAFDEPMTMGTFRDIVLRTNKVINVGYTYAGRSYDASGEVVTTTTQIATRTSVEIFHTDFWQKPLGSTEGEAIYYPFIPSSLNDNFQNCFYPAVMQGSTECVNGAGANKLNDTNPSCFDLQAESYKGMCTTGGCPFNPGPYNTP